MNALADLRGDFETVRAARLEGRATKNAQAVAYERWFHAAAEEEKAPDALRRFTTNEVERFWAYTIPGVDGHIYWDGPQTFTRNDGRTRRPVRWAYERATGMPLSRYADVWSICGEKNCITPEHQQAGRIRSRQRYTDMQIIGAIQVAAMRLGHAPGQTWWRRRRLRPDTAVIQKRFGSWNKAMSSAGLTPNPSYLTVYTHDDCVRGLRALSKHLGHVPSASEYDNHRLWLRDNGFPPSRRSLHHHLGGKWADYLDAAGLNRR